MSFPGAAGKGANASGSDPDGRPSCDQRLLRAQRLTARRQFLSVHQRGRRVSSSSFTLLALSNSAGCSRLGLTVSRKVGGAVLRNRVKRVLREVFRRNRCTLGAPLDLVVVARSGIERRTLSELSQEFVKRCKELARRLEA